MEEFEILKKLIAEAQAEVEKVDAGNKAAGSRVRKYMMDVKRAAQAVRQKVLSMRAGPVPPVAPPAPPAAPPPAGPPTGAA